jgi:glycosyltransferase involved in cell wall biosynthesis/GT2 family glycosyltransferase
MKDVSSRRRISPRREKWVSELEAHARECESRIGALEALIGEREMETTRLSSQIPRLEAEIALYKTSKSWRLTAPLRGLRRAASDLKGWSVRLLSKAGRSLYHHMPLSTRRKMWLKSFIFSSFGSIFKNTASYRNWLVTTNRQAEPIPAAPSPSQFGDWFFEESSHEYVPPTDSATVDTSIKLIAFYLPQYHPIPENDLWWGRGFTEWSNVTRAKPQFVGHYQPHLPGELGFYDLRLIEVQKRQIELAKMYGIYGFCYYYYWFGGKRLLEKPLDQVLANKELDLPFCICWANENWTRRWDGLDDEVLIAQEYSPEHDIAFIKDIERALKDERYISVAGKPLLVVYRPELLPDPKGTAKRWRDYCRSVGIGEIYLASTHAFQTRDPAAFGFDAALDFAPSNTSPPVITDKMQILNPGYGGIVYDYRYLVENSRNYSKPAYTLFRTVVPSWDNEARKPGRGRTFAFSSPALYRQWLENACRYTGEHFPSGSRFVFVNAWNEWAEGNHLEPDQKYGYAYLQATAEALRKFPGGHERKKILCVSHDAHFHGAQLTMLNIVKTLDEQFGYDIRLILCGPGVLRKEFAEHAQVHEFYDGDRSKKAQEKVIRDLYQKGVRVAICNTSVVGQTVEMLKKHGFRVISLIHELPGIIRAYKLEDSVKSIAMFADRVVFAARFVRDKFLPLAGLDPVKAFVQPQGLYRRNAFRDNIGQARQTLRKSLGLPISARIVLGVGYGDQRKGIDLFVEVGVRTVEHHDDVFFVWVGDWDPTIVAPLQDRIRANGRECRFVLTGPKTEPALYFAGADVYLLTSREDPFPSVVLEAMDVGVPVIGFQGAGGFCELLEPGGGVLVPYLDVEEMTRALALLLTDENRCKTISAQARWSIEEKFSFTDYVHTLLALLGEKRQRVSVIVPNYNYEKYLPHRLESIIKQTYRPHEIIFLDDCSTDRSVEVAQGLLGSAGIPFRIIRNTTNQGVFRQWLRGMREAKGDLVWIAEADDYCERNFLEVLARAFDDESMVLAYCQSKQVDKDGNVLAETYLDYTSDISDTKWTRPYVREGPDEIRDTLVIKNTIPNVSAVVMKRSDLSEIEDRLTELQIAGDWLTYIHLLSRGKLSYWPESLNYHRRHDQGATIGGDRIRHMREILSVQAYALSHCIVDRETEARIGRTLQSTYEKLGLDKDGIAYFRDHPVLRAVLGKGVEKPERLDGEASASQAALPLVPGLVSVVLVNWNGLHLLEKFMPSLAAQTYQALEIFMVDNGSTDGSFQWVCANYPHVKIIELGRNRGFSVPNNIAIRQSRGEYVLTLNTDMLVEPDFIERLVKAVEVDPSAGWAAPRLQGLTRDFQKTQAIDCFGHHMTTTRFAREADCSVPFSWDYYNVPRYVFGASACGALFRRSMLEDVALDGEYFDEDFFAYFEDVDLDWRAQLRGWRCLYVPDAVGYHIRGGTGLKSRTPSIAACEYSNRYLMMIKNDLFTHILQDIRPVVAKSYRMTVDYLRNNPKALVIGLFRVARLAPKMCLKRFKVQAGRKVSRKYMRGMIRDVLAEPGRLQRMLHTVRLYTKGYTHAETCTYCLSVLLAKAVASILWKCARLSGMKYAPPGRTRGAANGRIGLVIPVMPDLSHHFLYREAHELGQAFDLRLFTVFKGDPGFDTPETTALAERSVYYPQVRNGRARFYMAFVKRALGYPKKTANLLLFYRDELARTKRKFVTFGAVRDFCHPLFGFTLTDMMEKEEVSHIHAYCSNMSTNHAVVAAHLLDKSLSFTGYVDFDFDYSFKMLKEKMGLADFMVVHTAFCQERMAGYVGEERRERIHVVRIGLDFDRLPPSPGRSQDRTLRLLSICGLVEKKGLNYLIDACTRLRERIPDFRLYVIGDGPLREALVRRTRDLKLEDRVIFTGALPNRRVFEYLTEDSILVMPSVYASSGERDGIPTVIVEAMSMGVNVISTRVSGIPEVVEDGVNGLLVAHGDSGLLADAIVRLHGDAELFERLRKAGGPKVRQMFDLKKNAAQLARLLEESLGRSRGHGIQA